MTPSDNWISDTMTMLDAVRSRLGVLRVVVGDGEFESIGVYVILLDCEMGACEAFKILDEYLEAQSAPNDGLKAALSILDAVRCRVRLLVSVLGRREIDPIGLDTILRDCDEGACEAFKILKEYLKARSAPGERTKHRSPKSRKEAA